MQDWRSLTYAKWVCKCHVAIAPKRRRKALYGSVRRKAGEILRELCGRKGVEALEGYASPDHIHVCLSVAPKYSMAMVVGRLKGKSAIRIYREMIQEKG
ncbi:MAG: IS200/IS605 family transposase [Treponema sp.]|nr:IS200/IS605 family transposase [Treponema sp.]